MDSPQVLETAKRVISAEDDEQKKEIFSGLSPADKKKVRAEVKRISELSEGDRAKMLEEDDDDLDIDWSKLTPKAGGARINTKIEISEKELDDVWSSLESSDVSEFDDLISSAFDYQGFNADVVLGEIMKRGRAAGKAKQDILKDITSMCVAAHKKGSVTDRNYAKMKKSGQVEYDRLANIYKLVKGGTKGQPPETLSISRIGPTFPGRTVRLILAQKLGPKTFIGPMKSSTLASVMQTQFFPALLSSEIPERSKDYLIALCRAYTVDQSLALAGKRKQSLDEVWDTQINFVELTMNNKHPSEDARREMMGQIPWPTVYDKSLSCVVKIKQLDNSFQTPTRSDFLSDMAKFG